MGVTAGSLFSLPSLHTLNHSTCTSVDLVVHLDKKARLGDAVMDLTLLDPCARRDQKDHTQVATRECAWEIRRT